MGTKQIGISEDRLKHMLGVARKSYEIAKQRGHNEEFARKMFLIGYLHDVGYEFSTSSEEHSDIGADLMLILDDGTFSSAYHAIKQHGKYGKPETEEWKILNMADMQVSPSGGNVSVIDRLNDIRERYGEFSNEYLTSCDICYRIGLTGYNLAGHIQGV